MTHKKGKAGLTVVEMLVATALLGVLATVILAPLTGLFQMTARSTQTLGVTTQAQEVTEYVQGQWRSYPTAQNPLDPTPQEVRNEAAHRRSQDRYAQTCLEKFPDTSSGLEVDVSVWELNSKAHVVRELTVHRRQTCGSAAITDPPPMKRVTVTVKTNNEDAASTVSLTVDIPRP